VLSESKMEEVLYDIYLAEAEIDNNYAIFSSDSARKQELLNSVLKKHKITEAVLDTSLAWYSGRLEKYFKIIDKLNKRYTATAEKLRQQEEKERKPVNADNLALPVKEERFLLRLSDLQNNFYPFESDTVLNRYGGVYELQFQAMGISASILPVVTLCVRCADTTFVKRDTVIQNGLFATSIDIIRGKQAKKLYGFIYFPEISPDMNVFIQNFTLSHSFQPRRNLSMVQPSK